MSDVMSEEGDQIVVAEIERSGDRAEVALRGWAKEDSWLGLGSLSPLCIIGTTRECVWFAGLRARTVLEDVLVIGDFLRPPGLATGQDLGALEVLERCVVGEDGEGFGKTFKVVAPDLDCADDCQELFVVDFVVELGRVHLA